MVRYCTVLNYSGTWSISCPLYKFLSSNVVLCMHMNYPYMNVSLPAYASMPFSCVCSSLVEIYVVVRCHSFCNHEFVHVSQMVYE